MNKKKNHRPSLLAADYCCFGAVYCRLTVLNIKFTSVTIYRLNNRVVRYTTALHTVFPE
jgi:hypothetical protein